MIFLICAVVLVLGGLGLIEGLALIAWAMFETLRQLFSRE